MGKQVVKDVKMLTRIVLENEHLFFPAEISKQVNVNIEVFVDCFPAQ